MSDQRPPDDQVVTWGELRAVVALSTQYHMHLMLMSLSGMLPGDKGREQNEQSTRAIEALGKELERIAPGSTGAK